MTFLLRYYLVLFLVAGCLSSFAQTTQSMGMHKVKKKETIFGIANQYGITVEQLIKANPEMNKPGYVLKKGELIFIPATAAKNGTAADNKNAGKDADIKNRAIRVGIMLPLHDVDGDGRRMVEYYRGMLMACEQLKKEGISTDIRAWNVDINADVRKTLLSQGADKCDIIFGPLYTKQVPEIGEFAKAYGIKLVIPFSINGDDVQNNPNIFQVYQTQESLDKAAIEGFISKFNGCYTVFIDCNDKESKKGSFTSGLRKQLEIADMPYSITNVSNSDQVFAKAFSLAKPNVVVLNTGRSPELNEVVRKLDVLTANNKSLSISLFGYTEWLMYEKNFINKFSQYDTYVPSYFYYNTLSGKTQQLESSYRSNFNASMIDAIPRFAITGYDHAMFFFRGLHNQGNKFNGSALDKNAVQTQLRFVKASKKGGMQNNNFIYVHYNPNKSISIINF